MGPVLFLAVAMICATKSGIGVGCDTVNGPAVMRALSVRVVAQPDTRSMSAMNAEYAFICFMFSSQNVRGQGTRHLVEGTLEPIVRIVIPMSGI